MASNVTPSSQGIYISPYSERLFDFNAHNSKVYLARSINYLLKSLGDDKVIEGLYVSSMDYDSSNNSVSITLSPGKIIVDSTLIEIPSSISLDLNVTDFDDDNGYLAVAISYRFLQTVYENNSRFRFTYISNDGTTVAPESSWNTTYDRIILATLSFDKTNNTVSDTTPVWGVDPQKTVTVQGETYTVRPMDNISEKGLDLAQQSWGF